MIRGLNYLRRQARRFGPRAWARFLRERTSPFWCPACGARVDVFEPLYENLRWFEESGFDYVRRGFQTLHWNAYRCPRCGATDRDRLMALYMASRAEELARPMRMLDLAPAAPLSRHIRAHYPRVQYRTADLNMKGVDDQLDVMDMAAYPDGSFDCLLCSHVLEHVENDRRAMVELHRVLRPGGWGLILVPIDLSLTEVIEDTGVSDPTTKWRLFAQGDHVRMYSQEGLVKRLSAAGFAVSFWTARQIGAETLYRAGIGLTSAVYVVQRPANDGGPR